MTRPDLVGWEKIAEYLKADIRTAQRFEHTRNLPICRVGGRVCAYSSELEKWIEQRIVRTSPSTQSGSGLLPTVAPSNVLPADRHLEQRVATLEETLKTSLPNVHSPDRSGPATQLSIEDTENPEIPTGVEAETAVVLDGLTLNRASELMYDTSATASEREVASSGYVRSLEDFTLGIVFGRIFSGEVREVAPGVRPVDDMRSQFGEERIRQFQKKSTLKPTDLLDPHRGDRSTLTKLLSQLEDAAARNSDAWREHAIREIRGIGPHSSLTVLQKDPSKYRFIQEFWPDAPLQDAIPPKFIELMIKAAKTRPELPSGVHDAALREFFTRNTLAHILIFRLYQMAAKRELGTKPAIMLPNATRASLLPTGLMTSLRVSTRPPQRFWLLKRFIMPRILLDILDQSIGRDDFRNVLGDHVSMGSYRRHRELFATIVASLAANKLREADQAVAALKRLCGTGLGEEVRCGQLSTADGERMMPFASRQVPIMPNYFAALNRVFPELRF
jgi:hypothetical protein